MDTVEKHKKFIDWRNDIEYREIAYCLEHPEKIIEKPAERSMISDADKNKLETYKNSKITVEVLESYVKGSWCVWLNNSRMKLFDGVFAHRDATRFAGQLLNSADPDKLI